MESVLVILPNNLGDIIMATPVLRALKGKGVGHIAFLAEQGFEGGLKHSAFCDQIISFPRKQARELWRNGDRGQALAQLRSFSGNLKSRDFSTIVNLSQTEYVAYAAGLFARKRFAGRYFRREGNHAIDDLWTQYLYAIPFFRKANNLHAADIYRRIAGVRTRSGDPYAITLSKGEKRNACAYLESKGATSENRMVFFQPGAAFPSKRWPLESYIALGKKLIAQNFMIVISGAPSERERALHIALGIGDHCIVTAGETSFREAVANVSFAAACVTGDTALMHAACALDVPVYAMFGPTSPVETGPYGNGNWVFCGGCPHRPCFKVSCDSMQCMKAIHPELVFSAMCAQKGETRASCDVFRTTIDREGDYALAVTRKGAKNDFYCPEASYVARCIFDPEYRAKSLDGNMLSAQLHECGRAIGMLDDMEGLLGAATPDSVRAFEEKKCAMRDLRGVGAFCAALLNIRLNSVPVMNPGEAIQKSLLQCRITKEQIAEAIHSIHENNIL